MRRLSISPAGLVYLYPELFSRRASIGGFRPLCGGNKVKHDELAVSAIITTYMYLNKAGLVALSLTRKGLIFKQDYTLVIKTNPYAGRQGYLTRRLIGMRQGAAAELRHLVADRVEVDDPNRYILGQIYSYDIRGSVAAPGGRVYCQAVRNLQPEAYSLRRILDLYRMQRPRLYHAMVSDAKSALSSMEKKREVDYDADFDFEVDFDDD
ncbi:MAG: hypothetical protein DRN04_06690 [Thermoprotei archaeon]|nr:MAG: hypothetical protein DRN04_06690 [Thermoprotei archaeon]